MQSRLAQMQTASVKHMDKHDENYKNVRQQLQHS